MRNDEYSRLERARKHDCNGRCYPKHGPMCPRVDTCDETCVGEFLATLVVALLIFIGVPLVMALIVLLIVC